MSTEPPCVYGGAFKNIVSNQFDKIAGPLGVTWAILVILLMSASCCYSADVVFIRQPGSSSVEEEQLKLAADFYGLNLKVITTGSANDDLAIARAIGQDAIVGVAIAANALAAVNQGALRQALNRGRRNNPSVLILGVSPGLDPRFLKTWSGGAATGCNRLEKPLHPKYVFGGIDGFTGQLATLEIPAPDKDAFYVEPGKNIAAQPILSIRHDQQVSPMFVEARVHERPVFVACTMAPDEDLKDGADVVAAFLQDAPAMMFAKYCAGEQGWHAPHQYANLTIDDPWLRQSYGYVDFRALLEEMDRHDFHTTIAFIPWNFDRSDPGVVSLFRNHPDRFSIAVHGDNHDHKEFTDYRSKPLPVQIAHLKQSLARMEKFRALTGIQYDKVMVFPHSIAPEATLGALKTYNYLATVNLTNVPQDSAKSTSPSFALRPETLLFAGFPSVSRYSMATPIPKSLIAINEFLGNPLFFYGHAEDFAKGIGAFDGVADEVNKLEPATQWRALGDIAKHLYVVKLRNDSNYDVLAFSSNICLDIASPKDSIFYVRKPETGGQAIDSLTVDGQKAPYQLQDGYLNFSIPVKKGGTRCASVQYQNDLELPSIGTSKDSVTVYLLRWGSDFRDIYVLRTTAGLAFIRFYNQHNINPKELLAWAVGVLLICFYAGYRLWLSISRRHAAREQFSL